jgi:lipopolysaccharide export system permease protein
MLNGLTRYIFWQSAGPFVMATVVLTGIIWLTQALKMLDLLINQGQTLQTYFELSALAMPSAINTVLPIALFVAILYTLNKLIADSELVVMFSAGFSRFRIAAPILVLTALTMVIVLALNAYFMPAGMRVLKTRLFEIRGDLATSLVREGAFTNPVAGLTVYVRERTPDGIIHGILVHDSRNNIEPVTYMAESGRLVRTPSGPRMLMFNGNIQQVKQKTRTTDNPVTLLYFDQYSYDLSQYAETTATAEYESRERYLPELFSPAADDAFGQTFKTRLRAEGHDRLVAVLYPLMFALIAAAALLPAPFNRRGYFTRLVVAVMIAILARVAGFALVNSAAQTPAITPLIYLLPATICAICIALLSGVHFRVLRRYPALRELVED